MRVTSTSSLLMAGLSVSSAAFAAPVPSHPESSPLLGAERSPAVRDTERMETFMPTPPGFPRRDGAAYGTLPRRQLPSTAGLPSAGSLPNPAIGLPYNAGTVNSIGTVGTLQAGGSPGIIGSVQGVTQGGLNTDLPGLQSAGLGISNELGLRDLLPPSTGTVEGTLNTVDGLLPIGGVIEVTSGLPVVSDLPPSSIGSQLESPMSTPQASTESATGYMPKVPVEALDAATGAANRLPLAGTLAPGIAAVQAIAQQATGEGIEEGNGVPAPGSTIDAKQANTTIQSVTNEIPSAPTNSTGQIFPPATGLPANTIPADATALVPGQVAPKLSPEQVASATSQYPAVVAAIRGAGEMAYPGMPSPLSGSAMVAPVLSGWQLDPEAAAESVPNATPPPTFTLPSMSQAALPLTAMSLPTGLPISTTGTFSATGAVDIASSAPNGAALSPIQDHQVWLPTSPRGSRPPLAV